MEFKLVQMNGHAFLQGGKGGGLGFSCHFAFLCIIFKYFGTKNRICAAKLAEYKYEKCISYESRFHSYNM